MTQIPPFLKVKRNFATTAATQHRVQRSNLSKQGNRNMKPIRKPDARRQPKENRYLLRSKTAGGPEPVDVDAGSSSEPFVEPFSSDEFQWPPVEVPRRFRTLSVAITLPRCRSAKPHAVLGVNVATSTRGSARLVRPRRPVPFPLSRVPSTHLRGVLVRIQAALATAGTPPVGTLVTKIQSSNCSAFAPPVDSTPSVIQGSEVSDVAVLGVNVATSTRGSVRPRRPVPFPLSRVPSTHLRGVLVRIQAALGTVSTPVGALVTKIQSSNCSAFAPPVDSTPSVIQGSEVSDVAVLGVNVATSTRGSASVVRPRRPVPFPLSRVPSTHLRGVLVRIQAALATDTPSVGTPPVGTLVTKIQSSNCSAFAPPVDSTPSVHVIQGSEVSDVAEATTQLLQQNVKLHPVLGVFVPTRRSRR